MLLIDRNWRPPFWYIDRQYFETFAFWPQITQIWDKVISCDLENHFFVATGASNDPNFRIFSVALIMKTKHNRKWVPKPEVSIFQRREPVQAEEKLVRMILSYSKALPMVWVYNIKQIQRKEYKKYQSLLKINKIFSKVSCKP